MNNTLKRTLIFVIPSIFCIIGLVIYSEKEYKRDIKQAKQYCDMMHETCSNLTQAFKSMEETDQIRKKTIEILKEIDYIGFCKGD